MRATAFAGALTASALLAGTVGGQPLKFKRDLVTEVVYTTVTVANVIVWVDENGVPYETTTMGESTTVESTITGSTVATSSVEVKPTTSAAPASAPPSLPVVSQPPVVTPPPAPPIEQPAPSSTAVVSQVPPPPPPPPAPSSQAAPPAPAPAPAPSSQAPAPPAPAPSAAQAPKPTTLSKPEPHATSGDSFPLGVTYDPFKVGGCKTEDEINGELDSLKDFGIIRIYGMGCNVIPLAIQKAKANNQKVMAGIYRSADPNNNENIDSVVSVLKSSIDNFAGGDWSIIPLVSVENEKVNSHEMTASDAVSIIQTARTALRNAGYQGPVGAVETVPATTQNPSICEESDMALVNIHAWFDTNTAAEGAGDFVKSQIDAVKRACPNKRVIVTESGWPHQGDSHDKAVASPEAQKAALDSIRANFNNDLFLFNAKDSLWKSDDASTYNAEKYWGIS